MTNILIIDDEALVRYSIREVLEDEGYDVVEAGNGEEGLEKFDGLTTDLVITDIMMPEKEGIETIIELKERAPDTQIIAISGGGAVPSVGPVFLDMAKLLGADRILKKPVAKSDLLKMVNSCLAH